MKKRVLILERDSTGRALMERVLDSAGIPADSAAASKEVEQALDRGVYAIAIVDELAGNGSLLDEVRAVRSRWPRVLVIATGTLLSQRVLLELLRLGVVDALAKPFVPHDLREAVDRARRHAMCTDDGVSLDFAAALDHARAAIVSGDLLQARSAILRAHVAAPLDPDVVALDALVAELTGDDPRADRLYRVALVLRHDEGSGPPDPREGLARLSAYAGAEVVSELPRDRVLALGRPAQPGEITVFTIGMGGDRVHLRRKGERLFATALGGEHPDTVARVIAQLGARRVDVGSGSSVDSERVSLPGGP